MSFCLQKHMLKKPVMFLSTGKSVKPISMCPTGGNKLCPKLCFLSENETVSFTLHCIKWDSQFHTTLYQMRQSVSHYTVSNETVSFTLHWIKWDSQFHTTLYQMRQSVSHYIVSNETVSFTLHCIKWDSQFHTTLYQMRQSVSHYTVSNETVSFTLHWINWFKSCTAFIWVLIQKI